MSNDLFSMLDQGDPQPNAPLSNNNSQNGQLDDHLPNNNDDDDNLFNPPSQQGSQQGSQPTSNLDDMLANDDEDDDLFSNPTINNNSTNDFNSNQPAEPEHSSALDEWRAKKNEEIAKLDAEEAQKKEEIQNQVRTDLNKWYDNLHESQEKRAKHNKEVDEQTVADQQNNDNKWEKTVSYIDFNRSDLHERDVSRMKSLLLQLKH